MPMAAKDIECLITAAMPGASVEIKDLAGDGDHYAAHVIWDGFSSMNRLARTRAVYAALDGKMGGELHALQLTTAVPE
ncbi:MAG: BolA/IbaG family iron-sulfur metabolism protein [Sphingomonadales bacterium]|nr:BolA/IbaG family iron-sulfur metabolism protein [Sphingomonadales bacterium]